MSSFLIEDWMMSDGLKLKGCEPACKIFGIDYEPMCEILCRRYECRKITVITTNYGDQQLRRIYGQRVWERLNESYCMITFEGINFRTI